MREFNPVKKCIVSQCVNASDLGTFVGDLCLPCHEFVAKRTGTHSQAFRNAMMTASHIITKAVLCQKVEGNEHFPTVAE